MNIRIYDRFEDIPLSREEWNSLVGRSRTNTIFQTHEWVSTWWNALGHTYRLHCMIMDDGQEIRGVAPMMSRLIAPRDWLFLADANSDYCDFPTAGNNYGMLESMLRHLMEYRPDWRSLSLRNIPEDSVSLACLQTLCEKYRLPYRLSKRIVAPEIVFLKDATAYKHKYSVRRHCNRLEKLGRLEFKVIRDPQDIPGMLEILFRDHITRFREKGEHSLFETQCHRDFYTHLAQELTNTGWLNFSCLTLDDTPLAVHFGFEYNGTLTWYKPAFDLAYRNYSPGTVLIKYLIDYAQDRRLKILDFTIGNERFKARFSNATTYNRNILIYRDRSSALMHIIRHASAHISKETQGFLRGRHAPG